MRKIVKGNCRPISLPPIFGKIFKKLIEDSLYLYLISHELLNPNQSGFRPSDSTVNQLISITYAIFKAFKRSTVIPPPHVRSVYRDISKAFDRVWHEGLVYKLKRSGVSGQFLSLIQSFLKDRKQQTVLNRQSSSWGYVQRVCSRALIWVPYFFLFI